MDVNTLEAGEQINIHVATTVMELRSCGAWKRENHGRAGGEAWVNLGCDHPDYGDGPSCYPREAPPDYSGDIAQAWEVVDKMRAAGWWYTLTDERFADGRHFAEFRRLAADGVHQFLSVTAETPMLAICRAALLCVLGPFASAGSGDNDAAAAGSISH